MTNFRFKKKIIKIETNDLKLIIVSIIKRYSSTSRYADTHDFKLQPLFLKNEKFTL